MVQTIALSKLVQAEAIRYLEQVIRVVRSGGAVSDALTDLLAEMEARLHEAKAAYRVETSASQSGRLQDLDLLRDSLLSGLGKIIDGQRSDPDAALKAAALKIYDSFQLYNGPSAIARQSVKAETTTINSLLRDWAEKPALADALRTLGLQRWQDSLKTCNSEYETLTIARAQERGSQEQAIDYTVKEKIDELRPLYGELGTLLTAGESTARRQRMDSSVWLNTIAAANAITEEYSTLLAARATRAETKKEGEAAPGV